MAIGDIKTKALSFLKKFRKLGLWLGALTIAFVILFFTAFVFLDKFYPPEVYRKKIIEYVLQNNIAQHFEIESLDWSFHFPSLSVQARAKKIRADLKNLPVNLEITKTDVRLPIWKLLFFSMPIFVDIEGVVVDYIFPSQDVLLEESQKQAENLVPEKRPFPQIPDWLKKIDLTLNLKNVRMNAKNLQFYEVSELKNFELRFHARGLPGEFELEANSDIGLSSEEKGTYLSGNTKIKVDGSTRTQGGHFVGFSADNYQVNLDDNLIVALGIVEKVPGYKMGAAGGLNFIYSPDRVLRKIEFVDNRINVSALQINLQAQYEHNEGFKFNWALPETRVENLYLPFKYLRLLPFKGIAESKVYVATPPEKKPTVEWQISLNNLYADASKVEGGFDSTSSGQLLMSITSKGRYVEGRIESPKVEAHLDATNAALYFNKGQFVKRAGERFEILLKSLVKDDELKVQSFMGFIHTLEFNSKGNIKNFSRYVEGGQGDMDFSLITNRVNLRDWSSSMSFLIQSPPLEGFAQFSGSISGPVILGQKSFDQLNWRIDRFNLNNVRGGLEPKELAKAQFLPPQTAIEGRFQTNLSLTGRGVGSKIENANVDLNFDLTDLGLIRGAFKKEVGVPLTLVAKTAIVPNELKITRGRFIFHTADLDFSGALRQGQLGSRVLLKMNKPIELLHWKEFFPKSKNPLQGLISWNGSVSFPQTDSFSKAINWKELVLNGRLQAGNIRGRLPGQEVSIKKFDGALEFGQGRLNIAPSVLQTNDIDLNFSGSAKPIKANSTTLSVADVLSEKAWSVDLKLSVEQFLAESKKQNATAYQASSVKNQSPSATQEQKDFLGFLNNSYVKQSRLNLDLKVKKGKLGSFPFEQLGATFLWNDHTLRLNPFSTKVFGGVLKGSFDINAKPFYLRNADPTLTATLNMDKLDLAKLVAVVKPEMNGLVGGLASGKFTMSSQGVQTDQLIKDSSGRMNIAVDQGYFESFKVLSGEVNDRIHQSELKKWILGEAQNERCIKDKFNARLDASIHGGAINLASSTFNFLETDSSLSMTGDIAQNLNVGMQGDFFAGPRCLRGDVQRCLGAGDKRAKIPFNISGPISQASAKVNLTQLLDVVGRCVKTTVTQKVKDTVKDEIQTNPKINDLKKKAESKLKDLFQGP